MKANAKDLLAAAKLADRLKGSNTLSFGKMFRLRPGDGSLTVESTDVTTFAMKTVACEGELSQNVLVDRKAFVKALTSASKRGTEVTLELDAEKTVQPFLVITAGKMKVRIPTVDDDTMPQPPALGQYETYEIKDAKKYLGAIVRYVCKDGARDNLQQPFVDITGSIVATDGHRLLAIDCIEDGVRSEFYLETPAVKVALATLGSATYRIRVGDKAIDYTVEGDKSLRIISTRIDHGTFPDFQQVIPKNERHTFVETDAVALKALALDLKPWTSKSMNLRVNFKPEQPVELYATDPESGEMSLEVEGKSETPVAVSFGINVQYLADAADISAKTFGEVIRIEAEDAFAPVILKSPDFDGVKFVHVVMPMRV